MHLWLGVLWSPAPQLHPEASSFLGQSGPGSRAGHTAQPVVFARSVPVLCLSLTVSKKEKATKPFLQQVFYVVSLFGKRTLLLQGVCMSKREKEGVGEKDFYNNVSPWVTKVTLWLLPEMGTQRLKEGGCYPK